MKMQKTTLKYSETVVGSPCSAESVTQYTFGIINSTPMRIARHDAPVCGGVLGGLGCTGCLVGFEKPRKLVFFSPSRFGNDFAFKTKNVHF